MNLAERSTIALMSDVGDSIVRFVDPCPPIGQCCKSISTITLQPPYESLVTISIRHSDVNRASMLFYLKTQYGDTKGICFRWVVLSKMQDLGWRIGSTDNIRLRGDTFGYCGPVAEIGFVCD